MKAPMLLRRGGRKSPSAMAPSKVYSQKELRERRRSGLRVTYSGGFDLAAEIADICGPLARRASRLPNPQVCAGRIGDLVDAVHGELLSAVVGWLEKIKADEHLEQVAADLDSASKTAAVQHLMDIAPRPEEPAIGPDAVCSGRWAADLIEIAQPYTAPLADLLARALPPDAVELRGVVSRSERLCDLLREVDTAARQLEIRIEKAQQATQRRPPRQTRADAAREALHKMGIEVPAP
ncbi:hypothetical protein ABQE44_16870 [Mycolicibacterium sp. XJ2546]